MATVQNFIDEFKSKKIQNTRVNENAVSEYIRNTLDIKTYIPFRKKRETVEMVVAHNIKEIDGIKKIDAINQYVSFVVAMLTLHTNLEFRDDPIADYDLLAESKLLPQIIAEFKESYDECDILLKMVVNSELEDNSTSALIGRFLNGISNMLDGIIEKFESTDIKDILGANFSEEDLTALSRFLNTYNK